MRAEGLARALLAILVVGLVGLGLLATGGPGKGRMEKRDATRLADLQGLADLAHCLARTGDLPETLAPSDACPRDIRLADPFTGAPYRYERLPEGAFRLCAGFEDAEWLRDTRRSDLDPATGCVVFPHRP
ncbi:hypothetical protein [Rhodovulum strictum]|uniref:Uncharacterized protein n=1 Tax=Rhodovulum strictum TaxID=58314 RepID=A0A844BGM8_9RHOB|nr:hypothetical protein [Rhodovulum strictum]MRH20565.1 hypothetical protein [Rhodovulum strictum]